jgi:hypothetical protein
MTIDVDEKVFRVAAENVRFRSRLMEFAKESNRIDGITNSEANERMFEKLEEFLKFKELTATRVCEFNEWGRLRSMEGMYARISGRECLTGGDSLKNHFALIIHTLGERSAFINHIEFERLHPFTDGNGRTGRAIWLWQMVKQDNYDLSLGFLHKWYYQSLAS